jgi:hypothetical protein
MQNKNYIEISVARKMTKIHFDKIAWVEVLDKLCVIHLTDNSRIQIFLPISAIEGMLPKTDFIKVSRSCLVAFHEIVEIGDSILLSNGEKVEYTRNKRDEINEGFFGYIGSLYKSKEEAEKKKSRDFDSMFSGFNDSPVSFAVIEIVYGSTGKVSDFIFRYCNDALARLEGFEKDELIGKLFYHEVFPRKNNKKWLEIYSKVAEEDKNVRIIDYSPEIEKMLQIQCWCPIRGYCACILTDLSNDNFAATEKTAEKKFIDEADTCFTGHESIRMSAGVSSSKQHCGGSENSISVFETALTEYDDIMMLDLDKASMFVYKSSTMPDTEKKMYYPQKFLMEVERDIIYSVDYSKFLNIFTKENLQKLFTGKIADSSYIIRMKNKKDSFHWYRVSVIPVNMAGLRSIKHNSIAWGNNDEKVKEGDVYLKIPERKLLLLGKDINACYSDGIIRKALFNDYDYIIYFEMRTGFFVMYSARDGSVVIPHTESKSYEEMMEELIERYVYEKDRIMTKDKLSIEKIRKNLYSNEIYSFCAMVSINSVILNKKFTYKYYDADNEVVLISCSTIRDDL